MCCLWHYNILGLLPLLWQLFFSATCSLPGTLELVLHHGFSPGLLLCCLFIALLGSFSYTWRSLASAWKCLLNCHLWVSEGQSGFTQCHILGTWYSIWYIVEIYNSLLDQWITDQVNLILRVSCAHFSQLSRHSTSVLPLDFTLHMNSPEFIFSSLSKSSYSWLPISRKSHNALLGIQDRKSGLEPWVT